MEDGAPTGGFAPTKDTEQCQAGMMGYAVNHGANIPAEFISEPLKAATTVGGASKFALYLVTEAEPVTSAYGGGAISYALDALTADGKTLPIAGADLALSAKPSATPELSEYKFVVPATVVPAGAKLRLQLRVSCFCSSTQRMLYGGEYADAGMTVGVGSIVTGAPLPPAVPRPVVKGRKELAATGVGTSVAAYLLLLGAIAIGLGVRRARRA